MGTRSNKRARKQREYTGRVPQSKGVLSRLQILAAGGVIVAAGLLVYCNSFRGPFIFDGILSISENPSIRRLWPIWEIFSARPGATVAGRPVLSMSLALNYQISGLEVWSYHAVNLSIHILAGLALFGIVRRTLLSKGLQERFGRVATSLGLICALIWLVHPLQTGSVTYIVQRAESLMGLFYLLSLYCAIRGFSSANSRRWYAAAITACFFGVGTKEVVATVPLMILLYDRIFITPSFKQIFSRRWGLYVGLAGSWVIFGALAWLAPRGESVGFGAVNLTPWMYALTQCKAIVLYYLGLAFWPNRLVFDYGWPMARHFGEVAPYAVVLMGLLAGTLAAVRQRPYLGFLGLWFFVILGPSSSFVPILSEVIVEHRMYLPLAAVVVGVVVCGYSFGAHLLGRLRILAGWRRVLGYTLAGTVIVVLGLLSVKRNSQYRTELSIWNDTLLKCPDNWRAYEHRGVAYGRQGNYDQAMRDLNQAIKLHPGGAYPYNNRGGIFLTKGDYDRAIRDLDQAITLRPSYAKPYNNRGLAYLNKGLYSQAMRDLNRAIELNPKYTKAYNNRGLAYRIQGEYKLAIDDCNKAIRLNPSFALAYRNRGLAYIRTGNYVRAALDFDQAIKLNPRDAIAHESMAQMLSELGRSKEAAGHYRRARELRGG